MLRPLSKNWLFLVLESWLFAHTKKTRYQLTLRRCLGWADKGLSLTVKRNYPDSSIFCHWKPPGNIFPRNWQRGRALPYFPQKQSSSKYIWLHWSKTDPFPCCQWESFSGEPNNFFKLKNISFPLFREMNSPDKISGYHRGPDSRDLLWYHFDAENKWELI